MPSAAMMMQSLVRSMSILVVWVVCTLGVGQEPEQPLLVKPVVDQDVGLTRGEDGVIVRGDAASPRVAILFQDNLSLDAIAPVIATLEERKLLASFFVSGPELADPKAGGMLEQIKQAGHYIGPVVDASLPKTLEALRSLGFAAPGSSTFGLAAAPDDDAAMVSRKLEIELVGPTPNATVDVLPARNYGALNGALLVINLDMPSNTGTSSIVSRLTTLADALIVAGYQPVRVDQLCATAMRPTSRDPSYPPHWWTPASTAGAPTWEILPQAAGLGEVILSKRHELGLLSNFAPTPFMFRGKRYASLEGFWQMMKFPEDAADPRASFAGNNWPMSRDDVAAMTAFEAKAAGDVGSRNMNRMGIDWVSFEGSRFPYKPAEPGEHYDLIVAATRAKVEQNPEVRRVLLATGDLVLKPDHYQEPNSPAAWRYFEILTAIRQELRAAQDESELAHPDRK
jgi:hypothetical protein